MKRVLLIPQLEIVTPFSCYINFTDCQYFRIKFDGSYLHHIPIQTLKFRAIVNSIFKKAVFTRVVEQISTWNIFTELLRKVTCWIENNCNLKASELLFFTFESAAPFTCYVQLTHSQYFGIKFHRAFHTKFFCRFSRHCTPFAFAFFSTISAPFRHK